MGHLIYPANVTSKTKLSLPPCVFHAHDTAYDNHFAGSEHVMNYIRHVPELLHQFMICKRLPLSYRHFNW